MEMLEWIPVEQAGQIETVCELAREIWTDRYLGAYGSMELDYLLRTWQSPGADTRICKKYKSGKPINLSRKPLAKGKSIRYTR